MDGIEANREQLERYAELTLSAATALNPHIGYDKAAEVAKKAMKEGLSLREACVKLGYLSGEDFDRLVKPEEMTRPG